MALINCSECGEKVSNKAQSCPHCGNPLNQKKEEYLCCPKCGSQEIHAERKGFSGGKALAGALVTGGIGLLAGTIGSNETQITCLKCGKRFKAGEAKTVKINNNDLSEGSEDENTIVELTKTKGIIQAVVWYKERSGCSLKEAKDFVDSVTKAHNIHPYTNDSSINSGNGCSVIILIGIGMTLGTLLLI